MMMITNDQCLSQASENQGGSPWSRIVGGRAYPPSDCPRRVGRASFEGGEASPEAIDRTKVVPRWESWHILGTCMYKLCMSIPVGHMTWTREHCLMGSGHVTRSVRWRSFSRLTPSPSKWEIGVSKGARLCSQDIGRVMRSLLLFWQGGF